VGDYSISLVPKISTFLNNKTKVKEIIGWLVSIDIISSDVSNCTLGATKGYAIAEGAKKIVEEPQNLPYNLIVNGLEIVTERQVFTSGENFPEEIICPSCNCNIANHDWDIGPWWKNETDNMICPLCQKESEIHFFAFDWQWGFSDLGFIFWNWNEFTKEFIQEFEKKLHCEVNIVYSKI